jgi:hypothetical protein
MMMTRTKNSDTEPDDEREPAVIREPDEDEDTYDAAISS